jgi:hypothetical protein
MWRNHQSCVSPRGTPTAAYGLVPVSFSQHKPCGHNGRRVTNARWLVGQSQRWFSFPGRPRPVSTLSAVQVLSLPKPFLSMRYDLLQMPTGPQTYDSSSNTLSITGTDPHGPGFRGAAALAYPNPGSPVIWVRATAHLASGLPSSIRPPTIRPGQTARRRSPRTLASGTRFRLRTAQRTLSRARVTLWRDGPGRASRHPESSRGGTGCFVQETRWKPLMGTPAPDPGMFAVSERERLPDELP